MKKYIELHTVHFISTNGITLSNDKPRVLATEENLSKLQHYIDKNFLKIVTSDEIKEFTPQEEIYVPKEFVDNDFIPNNVVRIEKYTEKDIEGMNKKELMVIADELGIEVKQNMKVAELKELILNKEV